VDQDRDGRAERAAVTDAPDDLGPVHLEVHPWGPPVPVAAPRELDREHIRGDRETGRETLERRDQRGTVGLAGRQEPQSHVRTVQSGPGSVTQSASLTLLDLKRGPRRHAHQSQTR
jgi:hypothetical protein